MVVVKLNFENLAVAQEEDRENCRCRQEGSWGETSWMPHVFYNQSWLKPKGKAKANEWWR